MRFGVIVLSLLLVTACSKKGADEETPAAGDMNQQAEAQSPDTVHLLMVQGTAQDGNPMFKAGTVQLIAVAVHDMEGEDARQLAMEKLGPMGYTDLELKSHEQIDLASLSPDDPRAELCTAARDSGFSMAVFDLQEEDQKPSSMGQ